MAWSRDQYRAEVLEPARKAGNVPPADLYARYGLPGRLRDQVAFQQQVADVVAYWRELKQTRTYASLADLLLAAHAELERAGHLTWQGFAARQADARKARLQKLAQLAQAEAGAATHVGPVTVTRLRDALDRTVSEADVIEALRGAGVTVVDTYPALPASPHPKQADLTANLAQLSVRVSVAVVFGEAAIRGFRVLGGFRLRDGRGLGEAEIAAAQAEAGKMARTDLASTARTNVLAILSTAIRVPGDLETLLLSEIVARLRPLASSGFVQRAITAQALELGLAEDEAGLIAAAVMAPDALGTLRQRVADSLGRGQLRGAQRLAAGLPAGDPLHERIADTDARVAAMVRRADAEEARGRLERTAGLLAEAIGLAGDDTELTGRLAAIPPPPPGEVSARPDGDHVLVAWKPSPAVTGRIQYVVTRGRQQAPGTPSEGTAVAAGARTERTDAADAEAPPGADLYYSVFATRGGETWSAAATGPPVVFVPDVADVSVTAADASAGASWRPHPGAEAVHVVRREGEPPRDADEGVAVTASLTDFTDTGLRNGTEYFYRIAASYRTADGQRRRSAGVVVKAVPEPMPQPVDVLDVTGPDNGTGTFLATWIPPPYGQVRLVRSDRPLPWPARTRLGPGETAGLAQIPGLPRRGTDGRDTLELRLPPGRHFITPLTKGHNVTVVGRDTEAFHLEPVRDLCVRRMRHSADRMLDEVRPGWIWPGGATDALVRWPDGELRISQRAYVDEGGGPRITIGLAETTIEVRAVYPQRGGERVSAGATCQVPARGVPVPYRITRAGPWRSRQRTVKVACEQAVRLPALVVVRTTGAYPPDEPQEGETIARVPPQDVTPGRPVAIAVTVGKGPAWVACFVDPDVPQEQARAILLIPPGPEEMRVR
ncbi:MAG TPA: hypothetical protein VFW50_31180 [Streptosporangiaceae bacterium]|nr:hypothetical protein [Streptosporangiaceae bacterium]